MADLLQVSEVRFKAASRSQRERGLEGWATFVVGGSLKLCSVSIRRTASGLVTLSYPVRQARTGVQHPVVAPISNEARIQIEREVFSALRREGVL